jgi:rhodanese-related sulfurtransferase
MSWVLSATLVSTLGLGCAREEARQDATEGGGQPMPVAESEAGSGAPEAAASVGVMAPADLAGRLGTADEPIILDVRSPEEYSAGHIPGAINVPYDQIAAHLDSLETFRDREIVVYCRSGRRAGVAEAALAEDGFQQLLDLEGHMQSWQAAQYPVAVPAADCC